MDVGMSNDDEEITQYNVRKYGAYIPISDELYLDFLPFVGPELPPIVLTRRQKIASWISRNVADIRLRLGSWVAGVDLDEHDGYDE
jgi:hypothetical protein